MKKIVIYIALVLIILYSIYSIFKIEIKNEKNEIDEQINENNTLPIPDRIIYKGKTGKYIIINLESREMPIIYNELNTKTTNIIEGKIYNEDEIREIQKNQIFIEFDYNRKSKNYVFVLKENQLEIIKRSADGGQVITNSATIENTFIDRLENLTKTSIKYEIDLEKNYTINDKLNKLPTYPEFKQVRQGIYQEIIDFSISDYTNALYALDIKNSEDMPKFDSEKETAIITLSRYEINNVTQNIGNVKYEFGKYQNKYSINILIVSKVVNTNCIYYNINNSIPIEKENLNKSNDKYAVEYYIEKNKYYSNFNNKKQEIISIEKACDIADIEAQKTKYQYQPWNSKFYSRETNEKGDENDSAELISNLSEINRLYNWNEGWRNSDYKNTLMWKVRLSDENDPLTSLYIYINAINGNIIGAGNSSD